MYRNIILALISFLIGVLLIKITGWDGHWETFMDAKLNIVSMVFFALFPILALGGINLIIKDKDK